MLGSHGCCLPLDVPQFYPVSNMLKTQHGPEQALDILLQMMHTNCTVPYGEVDGMSALLGYQTADAAGCKVTAMGFSLLYIVHSHGGLTSSQPSAVLSLVLVLCCGSGADTPTLGHISLSSDAVYQGSTDCAEEGHRGGGGGDN